MIRVATWIKEKNQPAFDRAFAFAPKVRLENARTAATNVQEADALLLTGGEDISAEFHTQLIKKPELIEKPDPKRDAWEFAATRLAFEREIPILGICRGHQVLNVALGGTLLLDIPGHNFPKQENIQPLRHQLQVPSTRLFANVNSTHHQAVDRIAPGFEVEAWCRSDDVIEQIRHRRHPFCIGVQYHPELSSAYAPLFMTFVGAAISRARATS